MSKLMKFVGLFCLAVMLLVGGPQSANAMPPDSVPSATYTFHPAAAPSDAVMEVVDGDDGDVLIVGKLGHGGNIYFTIDAEGNAGFFAIRVAHTGDYLDADGIKTDDGLTQVTTSPYTGKKSQLWGAKKYSDGTYAIYSAISTTKKHFTLRYLKGKVVILDEFNFGKNWFWKLNNIAD